MLRRPYIVKGIQIKGGIKSIVGGLGAAATEMERLQA